MQEKALKIIDAHAHIFPFKIAEKAVQNIGSFYGIPMRTSVGTAEELIKSGTEINTERYIVSSTATTVAQVDVINSFIKETVLKYPVLTGLITLHPDLTNKEIDKNVEFALNNGLKGVKLHPDFQKFFIDDTKAFDIYSAVEGVLPILFHTGDNRFGYSSPPRLASVAKKFKKLKCVGAHFGGYSEWEKLDTYLDTPNVYFDTCSSLEFLAAEEANKIIEKFGHERFFFGTDFPMWKHTQELEKIKKLGLSQEKLQDILYNNAFNFYLR